MKINVKNLSLKFSDKFIFNNINAEFNPATINLIKGKNGAGKTCFLQCLCGVIPRHFGGEVEGGWEIESGKWKVESSAGDGNLNSQFSILNSKFGFLMQEPDKQLCFPFIEEELFFGAENLNRNKDDFFKDYNELIQIFPILDRVDIETSALSFGEKKVLLFCSQILKDPEIFLLDEPLAGLSEHYRAKFIELIQKLKSKNKIIIIAEHTDVLDSLADQIIRF